MITQSHVHYLLEFCGEHTYTTFVSGVRDGATVSRICYCGIENIRAYLNLECGIPLLDFFEKTEHIWTRVRKVPHVRGLDVYKMLHSAQGFESELAESFFFAYPRAEESFYEVLPNHLDVVSLLNVNPTEEQVVKHRLVCSYDDVTAVDDADGVASFLCEDGTLCVPYDYIKRLRVFQTDRSKFHSDSKMSSAFDGFFDKCYELKSKLTSLTLSGIMSRIENIMP